MIMGRYVVTEEGLEALAAARGCWNALAPFREARRRNKDYTFGNQWRDRIVVDGQEMTEEAYIISEGNLPLKNNLIRRIVLSVGGVFRARLADRMDSRQGEWKTCDTLNGMKELYARTMEEFLISGVAVHRKWRGRRGGTDSVWTDPVPPDSFFFDPLARDPRGCDISVIGQFHRMPPDDFCATFGMPRGVGRRLAETDGRGTVRVAEIWRRERRRRRLVHDAARARLWKVDEADWPCRRVFQGMPSRWFADDVWRFCLVTSDGFILRQGDSPFGGHPFVFKAYPFLDGEIHSFVSDIIDQQRYANRLITLYDWAVRASAKGVLLFPQDALPQGAGLDMVADQWSRYNGVIPYAPKPGQPLPQQVSGNSGNIGIGELLSIQLRMMEDVSGVNGAMRGRLDSQAMSGKLFSQQTENSMTSLRDILETFDSFIDAADALERRLICD